MPLEKQWESEKSAEAIATIQTRKARETANGWLSRLSPLLNRSSPSQAIACRQDLALLRSLRVEGQQTLAELQQQASIQDVILLATLRQSLGELDGIESYLRQRLAVLAPGDPDGEVDLLAMRARLAEIAALREMATIAGPLQNQDALSSWPLTLPGSAPKNELAWLTGSGAIIGLTFTTYHALQMFRTVGLSVPDQLLFWIACWAAGLAMLCSAFRLASREEITLTARKLVVRWQWGPFRWGSKHQLKPESQARLIIPENRGIGTAPTEVAIHDVHGKTVRFGARQDSEQQAWMADRINCYLRSLSRDLPEDGTLQEPGSEWTWSGIR